jgi:hypothetical protein
VPGDARRYGWIAARGLLALPFGFLLVAVPLAIAGAFQPLFVLIASALAAAGIAFLWGRPDLRLRPGWRVPVGVAVALAAIVTGANAQLSAQHVAVDRDPGVYTLTARWMANEHDLLIDASAPAFGDRQDLRHHGYGFYPDAPGDRLYAQFVHGFPAVLAVGDWLGGSWLLTKTNAVIGGFALLMLFAFATRLAGVWPALGATAGLAITLPFLHFARDSYSEPLVLGLLFAGLWLLWVARESWSARRALIAGLVLGATCMVRVDSFVYLAPLFVYLGCELFFARALASEERRRRDSFAAAVGVGIVATAALALLDGLLRSPSYLDGHSSQLTGAAAGVGAGVAVALLAWALRGPLARRRRFVERSRGLVADASAAGLVLLAAFAYFVRPHMDPVTDTSKDWNAAFILQRQAAEGLPVDGTRTYAEDSMTWLGWYLGPVMLALGVLGAALLLRRIVRGQDRAALPFLFILLGTAALYLWKPSIYPDQPWASRRYLPVVLPGLIVGCFWTLKLAWDRASALGSRQAVARAAVGLVAAVALIVPATYVRDLATEQGTQVPLAYETEQLCDDLDDRAAVAVPADLALDNQYLQTVQIFCGVPVVATPSGTPLARYQELDRLVRERGRRLHVLSATPNPFEPQPPGVVQEMDFLYEAVEQTLERRPERVVPARFTLFKVPVPPSPAP